HLFLSYNQRMLRNNSTIDLLKKIEKLKREQEIFIKKLNDSKKITSLNEEYKKELERVTEELNKVKSHYLRNNPVSKEEEMAIDYLRNINNHPINKRLDLFKYNVDKNKHLYANIEEKTIMRVSTFFGTSIPVRTRIKYNRIDIRLKKIKTAMSNSLDLYKRFKKEDLSGYIWINQCKQATDMGYPSFPVLRDTLTKDLPKELIELTKLNSNAVNICYRPLIKKGPSTNMAIGNSDKGMGLVRSRVSSTVLENMQGLCNKRTAKNYFKNIYYKFSEFKNAGRNEFEKCHKRHLHHWVHSSMPQVLGYKFEVTLNLTGVESPIKTFTKEYRLKFKNQKYDRCFLLNDKSGRLSKDSIFAPFLYQYMFPVTSSCTGVESAFFKTLKLLRGPINQFLTNDMTNTNDINRESITYQDALSKTVASYRQKNNDEFKRIQEKWLNDNVGPDSKLGKLSYLINGIGYFSSLSEKSKLIEVKNVYHLSELHYHLLNPKSFYERLFGQE
ncbi:MAG: hypothetical protein VX341_10040, partial [Bdellovibrionota bacterium]|nr:hypothetical protein [Bdellovibrionota bacterium]